MTANVQDAQEARRRYIRKLYLTVISTIVICIVLIVAFRSWTGIAAAFLAALGALGYWAQSSNEHNDKTWQFIVDHNWAQSEPPSAHIECLDLTGRAAHGRKSTSGPLNIAARGELAGLPFYLYPYAARAGQYEQKCLVLSIVLPTELPLVILDSRISNVIGTSLLLAPHLQGLEDISLEGDFDKYFKLYIQPGSNIEALSLVTPELMRRLVDGGSQFDIEISGKFAHVICMFTSEILSPYTESMLDFGQTFAASLALKVKTFNAAESVQL